MRKKWARKAHLTWANLSKTGKKGPGLRAMSQAWVLLSGCPKDRWGPNICLLARMKLSQKWLAKPGEQSLLPPSVCAPAQQQSHIYISPQLKNSDSSHENRKKLAWNTS